MSSDISSDRSINVILPPYITLNIVDSFYMPYVIYRPLFFQCVNQNMVGTLRMYFLYDVII